MNMIDKELERFNKLVDELAEHAKKHRVTPRDNHSKPTSDESQLTEEETTLLRVFKAVLNKLNIDPNRVFAQSRGKYMTIDVHKGDQQ